MPIEWDGQFESPFGSLGDRFTSGFGSRASPGGIGSTNHRGVDLSRAPGYSGYPAGAAAPGVVTYAGPMSGYGNVVVVEHPNGMTTRYGHLGQISVAVGDEIAAGIPVGMVGSRGRSTGPHLHFEVRDPLGNAVNPRDYVGFNTQPTVPTPEARPGTSQTQGYQEYGQSRSLADTVTGYQDAARSMAAGGIRGLDGRGMSFSPQSVAEAYAEAARSMQQAGVSGIGGNRGTGGGSLNANIDSSRFGYDSSSPSPNIDPSRFGGSSYSEPRSERFGGGMSMASAERFGDAPSGYSGWRDVAGPLSPDTSPARPDNLDYAGPQGLFSVDARATNMANGIVPGRAGHVGNIAPTAVQTVGFSRTPASVPSVAPAARSPMRPDNLNYTGPKGVFSVPTQPVAPTVPALAPRNIPSLLAPPPAPVVQPRVVQQPRIAPVQVQQQRQAPAPQQRQAPALPAVANQLNSMVNGAGFVAGFGGRAIDSVLAGDAGVGGMAFSRSNPSVGYIDRGNGVISKVNTEYGTVENINIGPQGSLFGPGGLFGGRSASIGGRGENSDSGGGGGGGGSGGFGGYGYGGSAFDTNSADRPSLW